MEPPRRILVPVDFSDSSQQVLEAATLHARTFSAQLVVLHVWEPPRLVAADTLFTLPGWDTVTLERLALREADKHMAELVRGLVAPDVPLRTRLEVGEVAHTILQVAQEEQVDLIILGTHGRRGLSRVLLGSVAMRVVAQAPCPVLTVRAPPPPPPAR